MEGVYGSSRNWVSVGKVHSVDSAIESDEFRPEYLYKKDKEQSQSMDEN